MKKRFILLLIIVLTCSVVGSSPAQAACPATTSGNDIVTNPASGGCASFNTWDGQGGNDVMTNNGTLLNFYGGAGDNTLTNSGSGTVYNTIAGTNNGTGNGTVNNFGNAASFTFGNYLSVGNGTVNNFGTAYELDGVREGSGNGTVNNSGTTTYISGTDEDSGGNGTVYNSGTAFVIAGEFSQSTGNGTVYNSGTATYIIGNSERSTGNGTVVNSGTVTNSVDGNYVSTGNGTVINSGTVTGDIYGNYQSRGNGTVTNSGSVSGNIYGNDTSSIGNSTVNIVGAAFVGGTIQSGNGDDFVNIDVNSTVVGTIDGQADYDTLTFDTHNQTDYATFLAELATKNPSADSITFQGRTYTWQNFEELKALLELLHLNVTWFSPNDERLDPHPAERIAVYCHADKNTVGVLLIDNKSQGSVGVSFKIDALNALGSTGTTYSFGANGVLSISLDADGHGYAAWNGGPSGANGQGDFAKSFSCPN